MDIAGGSWTSRTDPIHVNSATHSDAMSTELLVLRGIGRGRNIFWRTLEVATTKTPDGTLVNHKIETKEIKEEEIIAQVENYYFDRVNVSVTEQDLFQPYIVHTDSHLDMSFPYEISWLHFGEYKDYEISDPGLGYSLGFYAPGIKAHIYVYPVNKRHPNHKNELEVAIGDVKRAYGQDAILRQWEIVESESYSYFSYVPKTEPNDISSIFVISSNDRFVKVRITFAEGRENREFFRSFMGDLFAIIPE